MKIIPEKVFFITCLSTLFFNTQIIFPVCHLNIFSPVMNSAQVNNHHHKQPTFNCELQVERLLAVKNSIMAHYSKHTDEGSMQATISCAMRIQRFNPATHHQLK
jgi:hypothetical protein